MTRWRKKPVVIEADIYAPGMEDGIDRMPVSKLDKFGYPELVPQDRPYIETLEGRHYITEGDYIITGVKGERYPCKPDIFHASYEPYKEEKSCGPDEENKDVKVVCEVTHCGWHGKYGDAVFVRHPLAEESSLVFCPECLSAESLITACDEEGCWRPVTCGCSTDEGYRRTCNEHSTYTLVTEVGSDD